MLKYLVCGLLLLCLASGGSAMGIESIKGTKNKERAATENIALAMQKDTSLNTLGAQLLQIKLEHGGMDNALVSPVSLYYALSVLREGAGGDSAALLEKVLTNGERSVNSLAPALAAKLVSAEDNPKSKKGQFLLANALWADNGASSAQPFVFAEAFVQAVGTQYQASFAELDFLSPEAAAAVNGWAKRVTKGLIPRVISPDVLEDLSWLILNAAVFEGGWGTDIARVAAHPGYQFKPLTGAAKSRDTITTSSYTAPILENEDGGVAFKLPFAGYKYSLVVKLPGQAGATELMRSVSAMPETVAELLSAASQRYQLRIVLPVFAFSDEIELRASDPQTKALGLAPLYQNDADFKPMGDQERSHSNVRRSKVGLIKQNARIELDENGVSAAAVTAIGAMRATSIRPRRYPKKDIIVDRPFAFAIVENISQAVLFQGVLVR